MSARTGGGGGKCTSPPWKMKKKILFAIMRSFLLLFSAWSGPFWACPPPPTKISAASMMKTAVYSKKDYRQDYHVMMLL